MAIKIKLNKSEMFQAALVGVMRQIDNLFVGRKDAYGAGKKNGWDMHIQGASGEMAFAKYRDKYWTGNLGDLKADDVGKTQVRTTASSYKKLILHNRDPDDRAFVLVAGIAPSFEILGWIWGKDGKKREYWADPVGGRPAYFVPKEVLREMPERG